jgi:hypothetical protein
MDPIHMQRDKRRGRFVGLASTRELIKVWAAMIHTLTATTAYVSKLSPLRDASEEVTGV